MSRRSQSSEARPAAVHDRIALQLAARPAPSVDPAAVTIAGGPAVCGLSRRLLASYGVTAWETWKHASAAGRELDRKAGVEVASERQPAGAPWGFFVFPMASAPAAIATAPALEVKGEAAPVAQPARPAKAATVAKRQAAKPTARQAATAPAKPARTRSFKPATLEIARGIVGFGPYTRVAALGDRVALEVDNLAISIRAPGAGFCHFTAFTRAELLQAVDRVDDGERLIGAQEAPEPDKASPDCAGAMAAADRPAMEGGPGPAPSAAILDAICSAPAWASDTPGRHIDGVWIGADSADAPPPSRVGDLAIVATDGHRLQRRTFDAPPLAPFGFCITRPGVIALKRARAAWGDPVGFLALPADEYGNVRTVWTWENGVALQAGAHTHFPAWQNVMPAAESIAWIDIPDPLACAAELRVMLAAAYRSGATSATVVAGVDGLACYWQPTCAAGVKRACASGGRLVLTETPPKEWEPPAPGKDDAPPFERIGFNVEYMAALLEKATPGHPARLWVHGSGSPIRMDDPRPDGDFTAVLMPMRI